MLNRYSNTYRLYNEMWLVRSPATDWLLVLTARPYFALDEVLLGRSRLIKCWLLVLRPFYNLRTKAPTNERSDEADEGEDEMKMK